MKQLRADGQREEAAAVAKLRRPTVAAWAANQAIRSQPKAARELWAAGDALRKAHEKIVRSRKKGTGGDALREATARQREALRPLLAAAAGLLDDRGRSPSAQTLALVEATLHAASLDADVRDEAAAGRLTTDHSHVGF